MYQIELVLLATDDKASTLTISIPVDEHELREDKYVVKVNTSKTAKAVRVHTFVTARFTRNHNNMKHEGLAIGYYDGI